MRGVKGESGRDRGDGSSNGFLKLPGIFRFMESHTALQFALCALLYERLFGS